MLATVTAFTAIAVALSAAPSDTRSIVAERVLKLTRDSSWTLVASVPVKFRTYHPQGMVKIGETIFISSVDAGEGVGHVFKIDMAGNLIADLRVGEGTIYHPGGIDYEGTHIWVSVGEEPTKNRPIVYPGETQAMKATEMFRFADHIRAIIHHTGDNTPDRGS